MKSKEYSPDQKIKIGRLLRTDGVCVIREVKNDRLVLEHEKIRIVRGTTFENACYAKVTALTSSEKKYTEILEKCDRMNLIQRFFLWGSGMSSTLEIKKLDD